MARVIRTADTDRHEDAPQAAGVPALSVGRSLAGKDDLDPLQHDRTLHDVLYPWARDGQTEGYDCPPRAA